MTTEATDYKDKYKHIYRHNVNTMYFNMLCLYAGPNSEDTRCAKVETVFFLCA